MSGPVPTSLQRNDQRELIICWSDGLQQTLPYRLLRDSCQCATCMTAAEKKAQQPAGMLPVLTPAQAQPLEITSMKPVGNYAYSIEFSDGHCTGIFTYEILRSLTVDDAHS